MPLLALHSGDGHSGDGDSPRPVPPGQLVVTAVTSAEDVARGPELPLFLSRVPAGFPSPAEDYVEARLNLHELAGAGSPSCFFLRVEGESMTGDGIFDGDVLVVDRAAEPASGAIVIASVDGDLTVKRFVRRGKRAVLLAANPAYPPIELQDGQELVVWGVVTHSLRDHRARRTGLDG
jgi:DNA polymerase V